MRLSEVIARLLFTIEYGGYARFSPLFFLPSCFNTYSARSLHSTRPVDLVSGEIEIKWYVLQVEQREEFAL